MISNTTPKAGKKQSTHPPKSPVAPTDTPAQGTRTQTAPSGSPAACAAPHSAPFSLIGRIPVTGVLPVVEDGRWPAKAVVGEIIPVRATVFREGHDRYGTIAVLVRPDDSDGPSAYMHDIASGLDRYEASVVSDAPGDWYFRVEGWSDPYATWSHDVGIKVPAGIDVELMPEKGVRVLDRAAALEGRDEEGVKALNNVVWIMRDPSNPMANRLAVGLSDSVQAALERLSLRDHVSPSTEYPFQVDCERALTDSWYEILPCSLGLGADEDGSQRSGTLRSAIERLNRIVAMGFDVLYSTSISPIGLTNHKSRNNILTARPGDPGSPYGISSPDGGHDAIHPDLGTFEDFDALVARSRELGMEVAPDLALQCSPGHPWVAGHPEWFTVLTDGSIAYAENPPKKRQDIYPLNFDNDPEGIYQAVLEVVRTWIAHGVTVFRVDNPHIKPPPFWQRPITEIHAESPEVLSLTEAFTRPIMMCTLGMIGSRQFYTYLAWRNTKNELIKYMLELSKDTVHLLHPAFWSMTHDILIPFITNGRVLAFKLRAILAAMLNPTWGIYSGYELAESASRPGYEERIDNRKYEYKPRDFAVTRRSGIKDLLTRLNAAQAAHPALRQLRDIYFHPISDDQTLAYSKRADISHSPTGRDDTILTAVNLDPHRARAGEVYLNLGVLGLLGQVDASRPAVRMTDVLTGDSYEWSRQNYVHLDLFAGQVAHVFSVEPS